MDYLTSITNKIKATGFQCVRCGRCCTQIEADSNLVMVGAKEIREIIKTYDLRWQEVAEPYPETIDDGMNHTYTLGWCIRRQKNTCRFLIYGRCQIYQSRPWICRTYPFVLTDNYEIRTMSCPGIGCEMSWGEANELAKNLIQRFKAEITEEEQICSVLRNTRIPEECFVVIDSEGIKNRENLLL